MILIVYFDSDHIRLHLPRLRKGTQWSDVAFCVNVKEALSPQKSLHCVFIASQTSVS